MGQPPVDEDTIRLTFALPCPDGVWAHNAKLVGDDLDVVLPDQERTTGRVLTADPSPADPSLMLVTMEIYL